MLERVAVLIRTLIDYDVFTLAAWNEEERILEMELSVLGDGQPSGTLRPLTLGEGICGTAAALRQPIRVPNVQLDPRYAPCNTELEIRSEIAIPLLFEDRLIGVLDLESTRPDAFSLHHEQALAALATSLAIALANAELYESVRLSNRRLDEDLNTARKIQQQLLPRATPWAPGLEVAVANESARHLGGDFYDFYSYSEETIGIAIGDVAGKATSAALYGALAVGMLRQLAEHDLPSPAQVMARMNTRLFDLDIRGRFLALAFATFDRATRELTIANSGLPYPYLVRGGEIHTIDRGGVPLGLLADARYEEAVIKLEPEDLVVVASDGISEALDPQDEEFGDRRIRQALERLRGRSSTEVAHGLLDAVRQYSGTAEPSDDRTIVVLKVCDDDC